MKFVDEVRLRVKGGDGGNGSVAFRREKYVPFGGPAGGDGGNGGSVLLVADEGRTSLLDLAHAPVLRAKNGEHGRGKDQYGKAGVDHITRVPIGTIVWDHETGARLADLTEHGMSIVVAQGGKGGRGNIHFSTPFDRAPRRAEPGIEGQDRIIRLELKVIADIGLLGFPNVGKSTLVATMSRARPKVADYPFTTLRPHLGVVKIGGASSSATFVMADIPGLIPGASEGHGLGTRFLKHVERCRALLHLIAPPTDDLSEEGRDPLGDFDLINSELAKFAPDLAASPQIVAMSKGDLPETQEAFVEVQKAFRKRKIPIRLISAATGDGLEQLARDLYHLVRGRAPEADDAEAEPQVTAITTASTGATSQASRETKAKKAAKKKAAPSITKKKSASKKAVKKKAAPSQGGLRRKPGVTKKRTAKKTAIKKPAAKKKPNGSPQRKPTVAAKRKAVKQPAKRPATKKKPAKKAAKKRR